LNRKKHLFVGFGDIAQRCSDKLLRQGHQVVGIARSNKSHAGVEFWRGDVKSPPILARIAESAFDSVVITLTPSGSGKAAYQQAYYEPVAALCDIWSQSHTLPGRIIFVSSSSVYAQTNAEWVDHTSPAEPVRETARVIRDTEKLLLCFGNAIVVRFSGIYGAGRDYLLRQVAQGKGGGNYYTNRIHIDDCCGVILHLITIAKDRLSPVFLASDKSPAISREIRRWLAEQMGIDPAGLTVDETPGKAGNKRCNSLLLEQSGYRFIYPTYREGYPQAISVYLAQKEL